MTQQETAKILAFITATYPNIVLADGTLDAWTELLEDLPYPAVAAAVKRQLQAQKGTWLPSVGEIRAAVQAMRQAPVPAPDEAWGLILEAVRQYGYYRPTEALASLPEPVHTVAARLGWDALCTGDPDVVRGQFRAFYAAHTDAAQRQAVLAPPLRDGALADADAASRSPSAVTPLSAIVGRWRRPETRGGEL